MVRTTLIGLLLATAAVVGSHAQTETLDIYFVDTEGGQATILKPPSGDVFMIDAGFHGLDTPNPDKETGRDARRIAAVAKAAGITGIGTLLVTHFHGDHASGVSNMVDTVPVTLFLDHGPAVQGVPIMKQKVGEYSEYYAAAFAKGQHRVVTPGDSIAVRGLDVTVVQALGTPIDRPGTVNAHCTGLERRMDGTPEDSASVGVVVQFGRFRFANFGDLPWNQELQLLCPSNRVGTIDVLEALRHANEPSPAVYGMAPRIVVYGNGARKGGGAATLKAYRGSPGLEDIWQRHKNVPGGVDGNPSDAFSANLQDTDDTNHDPAHYIKVSAREDGSFTVYNSRTNMTKAYSVRPTAATR